ncbi:fimbrial biogenesis chaperone [Billgrantia endophytica]|uniref:Molecular chaperone n=1 Tax=Billgrantia endophytica TaxID=2033802 RepID=A0A2N7U0Q2_9GAMM|nr:molecular chaperone [Halomonas endophytica]PMR73992.1 molecular chaperone [Halomonas endophytica]
MPIALSSFVRSLAAALLTAALWLPGAALAASSILIWPIDPVLESDQRASALWLENRGDSQVLLQLRIFAWSQDGKEEHYTEQRDVIGSPPMIRIEPGAKQLLRLTRLADVPPGTEQAYRIVVDEIPTAESQADSGDGLSQAIRFQMRYSVPLFLYGENLWLKPDPTKKRKTAAGEPRLSWNIERDGGEAYLVIRNDGPVRARLTQVAFDQGGQALSVSDGLLGYVLAHSSYRWPLPGRVAAGASLHATVNGAGSPQAIQQLP